MSQINEIFKFFKDPKKREIENNMKKLGISPSFYTINKDYSVDITKDVNIRSKKIEECPVNFFVAHGNFIWHSSNLKSMKNLPKLVHGNLGVAYNKITSMVGSQTVEVRGQFNCSGNIMKNLNGAPMKCWSFYSMNCELESLDGSPEEISNEFVVSNNNLTSLKGGPKKVGKIYNASNNKLTNLDGLCKDVGPKFKLIIDNNPINEETKKIDLEIEKEFEINDIVINLKPDSRFKNMIGFIISITGNTEKSYRVHFKEKDNPQLNGEGESTIKGKFLKKIEDSFKKGEMVVYTNSDSKYKGYRGTIDEIDVLSGETLYKVKFDYDDNPGIIDIVSPGNKNKSFVKVGKIKIGHLEKYKEKNDKENPIVKSPSNIFNEGDEAVFAGVNKVRLLKLVSPYHWEVRYIDVDDSPVFRAHYGSLVPMVKKKEEFKINDKIIYLNPYGRYDDCRGTITTVYYKGDERVYDIEIRDHSGLFVSIFGASGSKLEKDVWNTPATNTIKTKPEKYFYGNEETKYKKGDKIIYISKTNDTRNKDLHLCKGEIDYVNNYGYIKNITYDIRLHKQPNVQYPRFLYSVSEDNIILDEKYKTGDKVIYHNKEDVDFDGKPGIIIKIEKEEINGEEKNKYEVKFTDKDGYFMTITDIWDEHLTKFVKPIGTEVHVDDDIIYTKPDSRYYGCKGVVKSYDADSNFFEIEIKSKDGKFLIVKKTKDENLELIPPMRKFKKGDRVRYINNDSNHDGLIGRVNSVSGNVKNPTYEISLISDEGHTIYLTTRPDYLLLLEEAADSEEFKFNQVVKYLNPNSKHNGRIGKFQGERDKDGKKQYSIQFDDGEGSVKIWFDEDEGSIEPYNSPIKYSSTTISTKTPTYTPPVKRKKKKEKEEPEKPIWLYNRRPVAEKSYKKSTPPEVEENKE